MPKYRTRSWRAFDPAAHAAGTAATGLPAPRGVGVRAAAVAAVRLAPAQNVRILGLDPGSRRTGFGVIEFRDSRSTPVTSGCIAAGTGSLSGRLRCIFEGVEELIERYSPDEVAIERIFLNRNVDSALKLGHARGAALCAVPTGVPVFEYAPRAIKLAVAGFGGAEKTQVAHMIRALLSIEGRMTADATDALAVAVCHAHSRRMQMFNAAVGVAATVTVVRGRAK
jgi:crossover junction endodeoxyribonuclease RuvC